MAALTRISNNQAQSNSIHADKLQRHTLTGDIWANNLVYDSTLTVANLVIYGNSTVINSVNTTISDPILEINSEYTGSPVLDQALLFGRGDQDNVGLVWREQAGQQFQLIYTPDTANSNPGSINVDGFANLQIQDLTAVNVNISANLNADWVNANSLLAMANVYFDQDAVITGNVYAYDATFSDNVNVTGTLIVPSVYTSADLAVTANGNVNINAGGYNWILGSDGSTLFPNNYLKAPTDDPLYLVVQTSTGNDNEIDINYSSVDIYAYNSNANSYSELYLDNENTAAPYAYIALQPGNAAPLQQWNFTSDGVMATPGNVIVNGNLTATNFVQVGLTTANTNSLSTDVLYANTGLFTGDVIANNFYTTGPSGNISGVSYVIADYYVGNGYLLSGMYSNINVAEYLPTDQTIIDLWNNAAVQSANIDALWSNAADQSANIDALWSNAAVQDLEIANILANISYLSSNIDILFGNAAAQSQDISALYSNAANLSADISALYQNAAAQSANIDALYSNAAYQAANIASLISNSNAYGANISDLYGNAAFQSANISALFSNVAQLAANIDLLYSNAAAQDLEISNIVSGTTTLDSVTTNYDAVIGGNVFTSNWVNTNNISMVGQLFAAGNAGLQGQYLTSSGSGAYWATHFYNDAVPPDTPNYGDIWYDIPDNKLYMWVTDGGSDFWYDFLPPTF